MNIALLQTNIIQDIARIEEYVQNCVKQQVKLICLPDYIFAPFFLPFQPSATIVDSKSYQKDYNANLLSGIQALSKKYKVCFLAPLVIGESVVKQYTKPKSNTPIKDSKATKNTRPKLYKVLAFVDCKDTVLYLQQQLMGFSHWNERATFANPKSKAMHLPLSFELEGLKIGAFFGFELHYDALMLKMKQHHYDLLIVPTASTFNTHLRWRSLCKTRAFLNSSALLRVNRVGDEFIDGHNWKFYGDSLFVNAYGEIEDSLQDYEGVMIVSVEKDDIDKAKELWAWNNF